MTDTKTPTPGRFVWFDVMSKDAPRTADFLMQLFGWTLEERHLGDYGQYRLLQHGDRGLGGVVPLEHAPPEVPSHWMAYVAVDDCQAACERAKAAGGAVCVPPMTIPGVGTFAVLTDPDGGAISPIALEPSADGTDPNPPHPAPEGEIGWVELHAKDPARAKAFYSEVFGWEWREQDMGPMGTYHVIRVGDLEVGGCMQLPPGAEGPQAWMHYVNVGDVDAMHTKASGLGASTFVPPMDIPGVGRFCVLADPTGAAFALVRSTAS